MAAIWTKSLRVRQRILAVRVASAYATVSTETALMIGQLIAIELFLKEEVGKRLLFIDRGDGLLLELGLLGTSMGTTWS